MKVSITCPPVSMRRFLTSIYVHRRIKKSFYMCAVHAVCRRLRANACMCKMLCLNPSFAVHEYRTLKTLEYASRLRRTCRRQLQRPVRRVRLHPAVRTRAASQFDHYGEGRIRGGGGRVPVKPRQRRFRACQRTAGGSGAGHAQPRRQAPHPLPRQSFRCAHTLFLEDRSGIWPLRVAQGFMTDRSVDPARL
jgi:hypothetical protein